MSALHTFYAVDCHHVLGTILCYPIQSRGTSVMMSWWNGVFRLWHRAFLRAMLFVQGHHTLDLSRHD